MNLEAMSWNGLVKLLGAALSLHHQQGHNAVQVDEIDAEIAARRFSLWIIDEHGQRLHEFTRCRNEEDCNNIAKTVLLPENRRWRVIPVNDGFDVLHAECPPELLDEMIPFHGQRVHYRFRPAILLVHRWTCDYQPYKDGYVTVDCQNPMPAKLAPQEAEQFLRRLVFNSTAPRIHTP